MENKYLHEVAVTAIVIKGGKYLIVQRSNSEKRFPGYWTVPGGRIDVADYTAWPKDTHGYWYNVLEKTLKREIKEETGIEIENIDYLTSLATVHKDKSPSLVIFCTASYKSGKITLQADELQTYAWVSAKEAKDYQLIDGILDEIIMAEEKLTSGKKSE